MFFTIVITTYNAEKFLVEALDSLKNQTFQDFDCVVTDDCSTDRTLEICKTWLSENPEFQHRTKIIESSVNTGVSANTNRGLKAASSEWIQVLSADDMFLENSLEIAYNFIVSNPNCFIFQGVAAIYNTYFSEQNFIENRSENFKNTNFFNFSAEQQHQKLLHRNRVVAPAVFYKKSIVEQVGFCDESNPMVDDWPLWQKLTKAGHKFYFLNETLINYRVHNQSISHKYFRTPTNFLARNPKHIAVFLENFEINGQYMVCVNYVKLLIKNGYSIDIVVANEKGNGKNIFPKQAAIVNLGNVRIRHCVGKLRRYLKKTNVSTLICFGNLPNIAGVLATIGIRKRLNLILSQHGFTSDLDDQNTGLIGKLTPFAKRKLYPFADHIIAVSTAISDDLKKLNIPSKKISVIPNFINRNHLLKLAEQPISQELPENYVVFVGRLARVKNLDLLIQAMEFVDKNTHLVIVGSGTGYWVRGAGSAVKPPSTQHPATSNQQVHFLGEIQNVLPIIKQAKIVAIPSFSEAMPMVAIEAAVLGKTVVHTPNQGCLEIFGTDGSYCSKTFNDPKDFAEQLLTALEKPIDTAVLDEKTKRFEESNSWSLLEKILKKA
jgi:alpha-1,3-rhamnosyltransferase